MWRDDVTLWSDVVSKDPLNFRAFNNLGYDLMRRGDLNAAMVNYDSAIRLKPDHCIAISNKGVLLAKMGKTDEAIVLFRKALDLKPDYMAGHEEFEHRPHEKGGFTVCIGKISGGG